MAATSYEHHSPLMLCSSQKQDSYTVTGILFAGEAGAIQYAKHALIIERSREPLQQEPWLLRED